MDLKTVLFRNHYYNQYLKHDHYFLLQQGNTASPAPTISASSSVSVSLPPRVSGRPAAVTPAMVAVTPMTRTGAGTQYTASSSSNIVMNPPSFPVSAQTPTLWFLRMCTLMTLFLDTMKLFYLTHVGNSSAVYKYTIA